MTRTSDTAAAAKITRRTVMGAALGAGAAAAAGALRAQQAIPPTAAPGPKGPLVFLDYDQEELDLAYTNRPWAPNQDEIAKRMAQKSALARARLGDPRRLSYGATEIEGLDLYATRRANAPIHVHFHGGTWRFGDAARAAYQAEMHMDASAHFIAADFINVVETDGDLAPLARQVRQAVAWIYQNAASFGGDPNRLYVSGHSSGGHLAAVVLTTDWESDYGLPRNLIRGAVLVSGIYDLYPVGLSYRRTFVNLTPDVVAALSPQRHIDKLAAPVVVAYGTQETPEFQRQAREFFAACQAAGIAASLIVAEGYNHFEMVEDLGNPYGVVGRKVLEQMQLGTG